MVASAPIERQSAHFSSLEAAAMTRAPSDLADLDRRRADAAGRAEDEQRLAAP